MDGFQYGIFPKSRSFTYYGKFQEKCSVNRDIDLRSYRPMTNHHHETFSCYEDFTETVVQNIYQKSGSNKNPQARVPRSRMYV